LEEESGVLFGGEGEERKRRVVDKRDLGGEERRVYNGALLSSLST
jgi:hypothetical protein